VHRKLCIAVVLLLASCSSRGNDAPDAAPESHESTSAPVAAAGPGGDDFAAALVAFEAGDYAASLAKLDAALVKEQRLEYRLVRAGMLLFSRRFDEARTQLAELRERPEVAAGAQVLLGHLAINARDYDEAHGLLAAGLEPAPPARDADVGLEGSYRVFVYELACLGMGWSAANRNEHVQAISWFDRILARQADDLLAMIGKGNSLIGLNVLDDAAKMLQAVLESHPENPYALAELAMIRLKKGEDGAAEEGFRKALAQDDRNYTCPYEGLGLLYLRQGRTEAARENLARAIEINPDIEYKKYNGLARIYIGDGNYAAAKKLLRKSQENFPHDDEAARLLAELETLEAGAN